MAAEDAGTLRVAAFVMGQNTAPTSAVIDCVTTVDDVERRSGLDFFWELADADEDALEAAKNVAWAGSWAN